MRTQFCCFVRARVLPMLTRGTVLAVICAMLVPAAARGKLRAQTAAKTTPAKATTAAPASSSNAIAYVKVIGIDYAFTVQEVVPAGIVTFNLVNQGNDLHSIAIFELPANHTLREFLDQYHAQGMIPAWMVGIGQTTPIAPQAESFITIRAKPGRYILACLIPARDGRMHTEKGMVKMVTVK